MHIFKKFKPQNTLRLLEPPQMRPVVQHWQDRQRMKGFIRGSSGSSTYNTAPICSAHQVCCCCFCWKTVWMLLTASKQPRTRVQHGTIRPQKTLIIGPLLGHQKASVLIVAITLIGLTLWANIPAIRYTSKHDCEHAPWHWVNMLAEWRNVKWDSSKDCVPAADGGETSIHSFYKKKSPGFSIYNCLYRRRAPSPTLLTWVGDQPVTDGALNLHCSPTPFGDASKWETESC